MKILSKIEEKWHGEGLRLSIPRSAEEVIHAFADQGIYPASDAVRVFSTLGGFAEEDLDSEGLTFWTIEKILRENDYKARQIYFADFLIDSHRYYFESRNAENSAVFVSYGETDKYKIADSFDEFFELYLNNIKKLFPD